MTKAEQRPDFFIVGAPKCGTTAMNDYLRQHPQVFMPERKDITYFGADLKFRHPRISRDEYLSLFRDANGAARIGETSVWYLYSKTAAQEIKSFSPSARIIVMLRNPVDMLHAQHSQFLYNCNEDIISFEEALAAEEQRKRGERIPVQAHFVDGLFYKETVKYSEQVERYFKIFGRSNVRVILFDDFKRDIAREYAAALSFLDVDPSFQPTFQIINSNKALRSQLLQKFLVSPHPLLTRVLDRVPLYSLRGKLLKRLKKLNTRYVDRPALDPVLRQRVQIQLQPEVQRLEDLLGCDLTSWSNS